MATLAGEPLAARFAGGVGVIIALAERVR